MEWTTQKCCRCLFLNHQRVSQSIGLLVSADLAFSLDLPCEMVWVGVVLVVVCTMAVVVVVRAIVLVFVVVATNNTVLSHRFGCFHLPLDLVLRFVHFWPQARQRLLPCLSNDGSLRLKIFFAFPTTLNHCENPLRSRPTINHGRSRILRRSWIVSLVSIHPATRRRWRKHWRRKCRRRKYRRRKYRRRNQKRKWIARLFSTRH